MMTVMGITAGKEGIDLTGLKSEITKIMTSNPRRINEIQIAFHHPALKATDIQKEKLKEVALTCPVAMSLSALLKQTITFNF